ncbi:MAG: peptide chain release factor N(5)-glutamine methyltransferase [bacterium]|nr:peptide chain release factor N(5)-glutamine methyltransferase [bacterium]
MTETSFSLLQRTTKLFEEKGVPNPRLDAELLLTDTLQVKQIDLRLNPQTPVSAEKQKEFQEKVLRRADREPLQYILGKTEFWGLPIKVTPDVLVPRPETELLVEEAIRTVGAAPTKILDIGTGSGCIAIALAKNLPKATITAIDISEKALEIARQNSDLNQVSKQIQFIQSDLFENLPPVKFDLIVANPPYVTEAYWNRLQDEILHHEPKIAIVSDASGLKIIRRILDEAWEYLVPGGALLMEIGDDQRESLETIIKEDPHWDLFEFRLDYHKIDRILSLVAK